MSMKWFKRIVVSIAVIIAFYIIAFWTLAYWFEYHEKHYFQDRGRIERITGVALPKFKVTSYSEGKRGFTGDHNDSFFFEFKNPLPDELFDEIDKKIEAGNTGWRKEGNKYSFSQTWGNGIPAPKGEDENDDRFFNITITRGDKRGVVNHGTW